MSTDHVMSSSKLVLIPSPGKGHLVSACQFAKHLINHTTTKTRSKLSVTILILPSLTATSVDHPADDETSSSTAGFGFGFGAGSDNRIQYVYLPILDPPLSPEISQSGVEILLSTYISSYKPHVRDAVTNAVLSSHQVKPTSVQLLGFVVDMFCTSMIDVANEFNAPTYVFFTSSAGSLSFLYYIQSQYDRGERGFASQRGCLNVPGFANPLPPSTMPSFALRDDGLDMFVGMARRFQETKGIIVNTFAELEPHAAKALASYENEDGSFPPVWMTGPILDLTGNDSDDGGEILKWLDDQPPASVVLLCFGSTGSFRNPLQVHEIAQGLEQSGQRFIWSLRKPPQEGTLTPPSEYDGGYDEILSPGYLEKIGGRGVIRGWVPQVEILAHPSTGGFVSHCGWNSILESLWFGVPIATWPMFADQPTNAFQLVRDLGLAVELTLESNTDGDSVVPADDIEQAVTRLLDKDSEVRKRVKEMGESSRRAIREGGSSSVWVDRLLHNMFTLLQ